MGASVVTVVAPQEQIGLARSSFRRRAVAVVLDGAIGYTVLVAMSWLVQRIVPPSPAGPGQTPNWVPPVALVVLAAYGAVSTWRGATLGMRAVDLRLVDDRDAGPVEFWRCTGRSGILLTALVALYAIDPWLVPAYGLLMFQNDARQLPHDLLTRTRVVHPHRVTGAAGGPGRDTASADPVGSATVATLDPEQARSLLEELTGVMRRVRGDAHGSSVAVLILGAIAIGGALVALTEGDLSFLSFGYWALAAPSGLLLIRWWLRRVQRRAGIRPAQGWLVTITVIAAVAPFVGNLFPYGAFTVGLAFLAVAVHERSRLTAATAVGFGVVVGLEQPWRFISSSVFANRFPGTSIGTFMGGDHGTSAVYAGLGIVLLVVGAITLRGDRPQ